MKVTIDRERCTGHGRCYAISPAVFDADDDGFGIVLDLDDPRSEELVAHAQMAAANCPEGAIEVAHPEAEVVLEVCLRPADLGGRAVAVPVRRR